MKVYVDELPKSCWDCPCHKGDNGLCKLLQEYTDYVPKTCPLQSLADYTKQVRKEVCERLDKIIEKYLCKKGRYRESIDISSIIKQVMKEDLDQIQEKGE